MALMIVPLIAVETRVVWCPPVTVAPKTKPGAPISSKLSPMERRRDGILLPCWKRNPNVVIAAVQHPSKGARSKMSVVILIT